MVGRFDPVTSQEMRKEPVLLLLSHPLFPISTARPQGGVALGFLLSLALLALMRTHFLGFVQVPVGGIPPLGHMERCAQPGATSKLAEGALDASL